MKVFVTIDWKDLAIILILVGWMLFMMVANLFILLYEKISGWVNRKKLPEYDESNIKEVAYEEANEE